MTGCAAHTPFQPATVTAPPNAFAKATQVLIDRGDTIETKDESAGVLLTKWEESHSMGATNRVRWSLRIGSTVVVTSQCQFMLDNPGPLSTKKWEECGNQPAERTEGARAIADAIAK